MLNTVRWTVARFCARTTGWYSSFTSSLLGRPYHSAPWPSILYLPSENVLLSCIRLDAKLLTLSYTLILQAPALSYPPPRCISSHMFDCLSAKYTYTIQLRLLALSLVVTQCNCLSVCPSLTSTGNLRLDLSLLLAYQQWFWMVTSTALICICLWPTQTVTN